MEKFKTLVKQYRKQIILAAIGILLATLFISIPAPADRMLNLQNYLITVGGIISAFVIAYLAAKIFNIKSDRESRQKEIDKLTDRLTAFRKILYYVMHSRDFWVRYEDIAKFKKTYPELTYGMLRDSETEAVPEEFWAVQKISRSTITLYLAMEEIYDEKRKGSFIPYAYDRMASFKYTLDDLAKFFDPTNQLWFYLDGRFAKYGKGLFNDEGLYQPLKENFREELPLADIKENGKDFHRLLLAKLGTEFYEYVIPKMWELIKHNSGIPITLLKTFYSLLAIMIFGVLFPIILQSIKVPNAIDVFLTLSFVLCTSLSLVYFLLEFYDLLHDELHPNANRSDNH